MKTYQYMKYAPSNIDCPPRHEKPRCSPLQCCPSVSDGVSARRASVPSPRLFSSSSVLLVPSRFLPSLARLKFDLHSSPAPRHASIAQHEGESGVIVARGGVRLTR